MRKYIIILEYLVLNFNGIEHVLKSLREGSNNWQLENEFLTLNYTEDIINYTKSNSNINNKYASLEYNKEVEVDSKKFLMPVLAICEIIEDEPYKFKCKNEKLTLAIFIKNAKIYDLKSNSSEILKDIESKLTSNRISNYKIEKISNEQNKIFTKKIKINNIEITLRNKEEELNEIESMFEKYEKQ